MKYVKDILFLIGAILLVGIGLKLLFWTLRGVLLLAVLLVAAYLLYRSGFLARRRKK